jgi:hypothetical protein
MTCGCAEHPLIGRRILAAERLASTETNASSQITALPIEPDRGKVTFRSVADPKRANFMLRDLPSNHGTARLPARENQGDLSPALDARLRPLRRDQWQLDGQIEVRINGVPLRPIQHKAESPTASTWGRLADGVGQRTARALRRWQVGERRLAVLFEGRTDAEQDSFRMTLTLRHVDVPGKGSYADVTAGGRSHRPARARGGAALGDARARPAPDQRNPAYRSSW